MPRLTFPPGLAGDTPALSTPLRYVRGNNIRFRQGRPETISLSRHLFPSNILGFGGIPRAILATRILHEASGRRHSLIIVGTHLTLHYGVVTLSERFPGWLFGAIDPVLLADPTIGPAYQGTSFYGDFTPPTLWFFQQVREHIYATVNWKPWLVELASAGFDNEPSATISTAVPIAQAFFITDDNIAVWIGIIDPGGANAGAPVTANWKATTIVWSDQDDYEEFQVLDTTKAGFFTLNDGSVAVGGGSSSYGYLVWTDTALFEMQPLFDEELVFTFTSIGRGCGLIGPKAWSEVDGRVFWLAPSGKFFVYDGGAVREVPCDVEDETVQRINTRQNFIITCDVDKANEQIIWRLPRGTGQIAYAGQVGQDIDSYVSLNYRDGSWSYGDQIRTCGQDRGRLPGRFTCGFNGVNGTVYEEDIPPGNAEALPLAWSLTTAPIEGAQLLPKVDSYDRAVSIDRIYLDRQSEVGPAGESAITLELRGQDWPDAAETIQATVTKLIHPFTRQIDVRIEARQIEMTLSADEVAQHQFGDWFINAAPGNER